MCSLAGLRRQRYTGKQIAAEVGVFPALVIRILRRLGLNRIATWSQQAVRRYARAAPGEIIYIDSKKFTASRAIGPGGAMAAASAENTSSSISTRRLLQDFTDGEGRSAVPFVKAAVTYFKVLGEIVTRVINGSCCKLSPSALAETSAFSTSAPKPYAQNQRQG